MTPTPPVAPGEDYEEVAALIATLRAAEKRLEELTGGEIDTVTDPDGGTFVLRHAQEQLRHREVEKQAAILNALHAHVALLDPQGVIVSVNEGWRNFGQSNAYQGPGYGLGLSYLEVCDRASGDRGDEAHQVAAGIRAVLAGQKKNFSIEYPCHAPAEPRWFLLRVTPLALAGGLGAVVMHVNITERKLAEISLRASEREQRLLAGQLEREKIRLVEAQAVAKVGSWETELTTLMVSWSRETHRIFETDPASFVPTHQGFLQLVHPDDQKMVDEAFLASLNHPSPCSLEHRLRLPDGRVKFVEERWHVLFDAAGNAQRCLGTTHDITERKQAEATLQALTMKTERRERMLTTTLSSLSDFTYIYDRQGRFLFANEPLLKLWGRTLEEVVGKNFSELGYPAELAAQLQREVETVFTTGKSFTGETPYTSPTGVDGVYEYIFSPAMAGDGAVDFVVGSTRDITQRKRVEVDIRFHAHRFRSLVEATSAMVWDTPASGEFEVEQPGWAAVTGQTFAEYRGWGWLNAVHPDDRAETARVWTAAVASRSVYRVEHRLLTRDQTYRDMVVRAVPVLDGSGTILQWTGIHTDITERKQLEEQLRQSQKMEAFGQLAGGVAHDFNNILTVIQGHAGLAEAKGGAPPHVLDSLRQISLAATRAAALTRQLLTFSHKQVLELRDLDVNEVVSNMTKMLRRILREDVSMELKQTSQPQIVHADAGMIEQILMNLTVNARDAMPQGGQLLIKVHRVEFTEATMAAHPQARPGSFVRFSVSDTGTGIPPEILPRIFEPFFTTKEVGQGTGLGLATVFSIAQQHLGWIEVDSVVGQGTTFYVYLPRRADAQLVAEVEAPAALPSGGSETILLVEDEPAVQFLVEAVLTQSGYNVLTAATGAQALAVWQQYRTGISLLLTDLVMPDGMSGKELGGRLAAEQPDLRIIYISGYSAEIAGKDFPLKDGVNFLGKPFSAAKLLAAVRQNLDSRRSTAPFHRTKS